MPFVAKQDLSLAFASDWTEFDASSLTGVTPATTTTLTLEVHQTAGGTNYFRQDDGVGPELEAQALGKSSGVISKTQIQVPITATATFDYKQDREDGSFKAFLVAVDA